MNIRSATPQDVPSIARVHIASWRSAYRDLLPAKFLDSLSQEKHEARHVRMMSAPGNVHLVAEDEQAGIVGFITGGPERHDDPDYHGEIYAIYLLEEHQRKGIGKSLVIRLVARLHSAGITSMIVWVIEGNNAQAFYERLGGHPGRTEPMEIGGKMLQMVAVKWKDTSGLRY